MMRHLLLNLLLLLPTPALAADTAVSGWLGSSMRMLGGLVLVLGLVLVIFAISRRRLALPGSRRSEQLIKVLEMRHFGPKRSLALVEVKGEELLLGLGGDRINLVCRLDNEPDSSFSATLDQQLDNR